MKEGKLQIYCGNGKGKTTAAIGQAIREASKGRSVFIVQFLKGKQEEEISRIIWTDIRRAWRIVAFENDKNLIWMAHKRLQ